MLKLFYIIPIISNTYLYNISKIIQKSTEHVKLNTHTHTYTHLITIILMEGRFRKAINRLGQMTNEM